MIHLASIRNAVNTSNVTIQIGFKLLGISAISLSITAIVSYRIFAITVIGHRIGLKVFQDIMQISLYLVFRVSPFTVFNILLYAPLESLVAPDTLCFSQKNLLFVFD